MPKVQFRQLLLIYDGQSAYAYTFDDMTTVPAVNIKRPTMNVTKQIVEGPWQSLLLILQQLTSGYSNRNDNGADGKKWVD